MTTEAIKLELEPRQVLGKKVKQLRRQGTVPVHLYGPNIEPKSLQCEQKTLLRTLAQAGSANPITLTIQGEAGESLAFAREIQWSPVRGELLHVDFLAVSSSASIAAQVPVSLYGQSPGAQATGGSVAQVLFSVEVEALPLELPSEIEIDLSQLVDINAVLRAGDLPLPASVTLLTDSEAIVLRVDAGHEQQQTEGGEAADRGAQSGEGAGG